MANENIRQFHANLDNIHSQDLDLYDATDDEVADAYIERFGDWSDAVDFDAEIIVWRNR